MKITGILLLAVLMAAMVSVVMGEGWAADEKGNILVIYKYEGGNAKLPPPLNCFSRYLYYIESKSVCVYVRPFFTLSNICPFTLPPKDLKVMEKGREGSNSRSCIPFLLG